MITEERIQHTYGELRLATELFHNFGMASVKCKRQFEEAKLKGLMNDTIKGKSETMRQAAAVAAYPRLWNELQEADHTLELAKNSLGRYKIEVEQLRMEMRLLEVMSQNNNEPK